MTASTEGQPVRNAVTTAADETTPMTALNACRPYMRCVRRTNPAAGRIVMFSIVALGHQRPIIPYKPSTPEMAPAPVSTISAVEKTAQAAGTRTLFDRGSAAFHARGAGARPIVLGAGLCRLLIALRAPASGHCPGAGTLSDAANKRVHSSVPLRRLRGLTESTLAARSVF